MLTGHQLTVSLGGAMNYWSVYLTGLTTSAPVAGSSGTSSSATNPSATTSAKPSVVTVGGNYSTINYIVDGSN